MLRKKPTVLPEAFVKDIEKLKMGKIEKDNWSAMFHQGSKERGDIQKCLFTLPDKHVFSTSCLNYVLEIIEQCNANDAAMKKFYSDMT